MNRSVFSEARLFLDANKPKHLIVQHSLLSTCRERAYYHLHILNNIRIAMIVCSLIGT